MCIFWRPLHRPRLSQIQEAFLSASDKRPRLRAQFGRSTRGSAFRRRKQVGRYGTPRLYTEARALGVQLFRRRSMRPRSDLLFSILYPSLGRFLRTSMTKMSSHRQYFVGLLQNADHRNWGPGTQSLEAPYARCIPSSFLTVS